MYQWIFKSLQTRTSWPGLAPLNTASLRLLEAQCSIKVCNTCKYADFNVKMHFFYQLGVHLDINICCNFPVIVGVI